MKPVFEILHLRREYVIQSVDGAQHQADATIRFLMLGDDRLAIAAFQRVVDFVKLAAVEMNEIRAATTPPVEEATVECR